jgi:hypothetical protein
MNADIAEVITLVLAVYAASVLLLCVLSFVGSAVALNGLAKLDTWMRHKDHVRPTLIEKNSTDVKGP